jgi:hypothetical protein
MGSVAGEHKRMGSGVPRAPRDVDSTSLLRDCKKVTLQDLLKYENFPSELIYLNVQVIEICHPIKNWTNSERYSYYGAMQLSTQ